MLALALSSYVRDAGGGHSFQMWADETSEEGGKPTQSQKCERRTLLARKRVGSMGVILWGESDGNFPKKRNYFPSSATRNISDRARIQSSF